MLEDQDPECGAIKREESGGSNKKTMEMIAWLILPTITWLTFVGLASAIFAPLMAPTLALCLGFFVGSGAFAFALVASGSVGTTFELNITCIGLLALALILYPVFGRAREVRDKNTSQAARVRAEKRSWKPSTTLPNAAPTPSKAL